MKIKNQFTPNAVIDPGFEYHESNRAWQGAPSIAMTDSGRLFVGFMSGGIYEPDPRNHMVLVYSDDKGDTWSEPVLVIESKPENNTRCFEIELWRSPKNELWMFWVEVPYKKGLSLPTYEQQINMENDSEYHALESQSVTYVSICEDPDADELEFSEPRSLFNAVIRNTPYVTDSGRWLFPTYITSPREFYQFHYSDDCGKTFHPTEKCFGRATGRAYDEPSFHKCADGRIAVTVRTTPKMEDPHTYKRMFSSDDGITWSQPEEFMLAASQRPCTGNISDGRVVMIPSISARARNGFKLTISDDGINFRDVMLLDDRERISYAEFVEDADGTLYIAYDRERNNKLRKSRVTGLSEAAKEILFARIPKAAWESGNVTPDTVRARVITKARINELDNKYTK